MNRRTFLGGAAVTVSATIAGCVAGGSSADESEYDVGMSATAFQPRRIEVPVGESVVWRNTNSRAHTVTAYDDGIPDEADYFASGEFDSERDALDAFENSFGGAIASSGEYEHAFTVAGQYDYYCIPHEHGGMVGTVVVRE